MADTQKRSFSQGIGKWAGTAEVYSGNGEFVGNATDRRHVQQQAGENRVRIDLSFVGPLKFAGHYYIEDCGDYRLYQGPANVGYAETLANNLIDANAYWAEIGLSQRFFLMILPGGQKQISLGLMSRGEELIYVIVGEYDRVENDNAPPPNLISGAAYDLQGDPTAGRGQILLHRPGSWQGQLTALDSSLKETGSATYRETVSSGLTVEIEGGNFSPDKYQFSLKTNGRQAWTPPGPVVGSYSLSGGRALSGQFHYLEQQLRLWRREVVTHNGLHKAVLHVWYRGGERVGVQYGVLAFQDGEIG